MNKRGANLTCRKSTTGNIHRMISFRCRSVLYPVSSPVYYNDVITFSGLVAVFGSVSYVHRLKPLWRKLPFSNRAWCLVMPFVYVLHRLFIHVFLLSAQLLILSRFQSPNKLYINHIISIVQVSTREKKNLVLGVGAFCIILLPGNQTFTHGGETVQLFITYSMK